MAWDRNSSPITTEAGRWLQAPARLGEERTIFAIGDVHGCAPHLDALHAMIAARIELAYDPSRVSVVWLGDYIDRGPFPLECIDLVRRGLGRPGVNEVRLLGNHDHYLIEAVSDRGLAGLLLREWLWNGGDVTLRALVPHADPYDPGRLGRDLGDALGGERIGFLRSLRVMAPVAAGYVAVHAGIRPPLPLERQQPADLILIREPFLEAQSWPYDFVVIHGHTPTGPAVRAHRIGVDSGAFATGVLTAVEIHGDRMRFLHALSPGAERPEVDDAR